MNHPKPRSKVNLPELQSINRITNLPIVETGFYYAGNIYNRLKLSNELIKWTFNQAESSLYNVIDTASPAVLLFEGPLNTIDKILCQSLDFVESKVPAINLPPQMIYFNTKQYVSEVGTKLVRPVLKRADSVKLIGNTVLSSRYTAFAADKLDGALNVADMYVDKYLPASEEDVNDDITVLQPVEGPNKKAIETSQHVYRFSRKLTRRLTRRTMMEAHALKEQSAEAIHVLVYVAELVVTDPKLAFQKGKELWVTLSKDEPENQARPENLEQLIVLLTRETARRVVHLVNFTAAGLGKVPTQFNKIFQSVTNSCLNFLDAVLKTVHLETIADNLRMTAKAKTQSLTYFVQILNVRATDLLEQLVLMFSPQNSSKKLATAPTSTPIPIPQVQTSPPIEGDQKANKINNMQLNAQQDSLRPPVTNRTQLKTHRYVNNVNNLNGDSKEPIKS